VVHPEILIPLAIQLIPFQRNRLATRPARRPRLDNYLHALKDLECCFYSIHPNSPSKNTKARSNFSKRANVLLCLVHRPCLGRSDCTANRFSYDLMLMLILMHMYMCHIYMNTLT
jgi:hypothetical protein